eukprot:CAMPEP_0117680052 /NCGR_PEP_ID=MMETSP0804-20121206/18133_1 /TAXON_ID=1074897 /ORGANISM="Tetraselmis astigmatica, Strain CCMP880" /LENGTH=82 /DNA_ID=CAMNT_0005489497 /DNA_START=305 /DNA_END=553 /DNA_ORIENTATION=+
MSLSGPPPGGATPTAATSRTPGTSEAMHVRSISTELTFMPPRFMVSSDRPRAQYTPPAMRATVSPCRRRVGPPGVALGMPLK